MKNYFTCKRIKLITPLDILWSENKVISNYNLCKLLNFTKKIEEPHMYAQRLIITNSQNICFFVNHYLLRHKATQVNATFTLKKKKSIISVWGFMRTVSMLFFNTVDLSGALFKDTTFSLSNYKISKERFFLISFIFYTPLFASL